MVIFNPPRLELARLPTPLQPLDRISEIAGGPRIWIKRDDLTDTIASGNKLRKLEFTVARALSEGADLLVTCGGIQSNHCRATAWVASKLGIRCHLILRGEPPAVADGNLLLDYMLGAKISYAPNNAFANLDKTIGEIKQRYPDKLAYFIPIGASDSTGLWGYIDCCSELKKDFAREKIHPEYIISATGSGGTLGGLIIGIELHRLSAKTIAFNVCDDEAYFLKKISDDFVDWEKRYPDILETSKLPINIIDGYVGPGYGRAEKPVFETIKKVAQLEGVILDPVYTGKAFHAMLQEIASGRFGKSNNIVFIHTGGLYGNFPHRDEFQFRI
ncbi:MAG: D-cysteine desulfhydrase [Gammaproteobacteria bacterium]|nr:D-cysteine desulfhydrase [Gammaproteobacteria bacterium]